MMQPRCFASIRKKLRSLREARDVHACDRHVLHVWAESESIARVVHEAAALVGVPCDTLIYITVPPRISYFREMFEQGKGWALSRL